MIPELGAGEALLVGWAVCAVMMFALWRRSLTTRNAGIVDLGWTVGLGLLAILHAAVSPGDPARRALVAILGAVWAFRLAAHLAVRMRGEGEDPRYAVLREKWGESADRYFLPGVTIHVDDKATSFLIGQGFNEDYGARPLRRAIERFIEDPMAEKLLQWETEHEGEQIVVDVTVEGEIEEATELSFTHHDAPPKEEPAAAGAAGD